VGTLLITGTYALAYPVLRQIDRLDNPDPGKIGNKKAFQFKAQSHDGQAKDG
jgi:hypothetical protein